MNLSLCAGLSSPPVARSSATIAAFLTSSSLFTLPMSACLQFALSFSRPTPGRILWERERLLSEDSAPEFLFHGLGVGSLFGDRVGRLAGLLDGFELGLHRRGLLHERLDRLGNRLGYVLGLDHRLGRASGELLDAGAARVRARRGLRRRAVVRRDLFDEEL